MLPNVVSVGDVYGARAATSSRATYAVLDVVIGGWVSSRDLATKCYIVAPTCLAHDKRARTYKVVTMAALLMDRPEEPGTGVGVLIC